MSRVLSDLLGASEPMFTQHINRLEQESGNPAVDLHLTSDISKKVRQKIKELGLDPADTNGRELYHSLQSLVKKHDGFLANSLGIKDSANVQEVTDGVIKAIQKLPIPQTCWALKHSVAKRLLRETPPKRVMKHLHYRSVDSLLKRANIDEVFAAVNFAESASWLERFTAGYKRLGPSDFESRRISIIELSPKHWGDLAESYVDSNHHNIIKVNELGVIAILPLPVDRLPGLTITLLPLIVYHINEIRSLSSYLKLSQVKPDFSLQFARASSGLLKKVASLQGQPMSWNTIQQHFGSLSGRSHPEVFTPHIQPEDLRWKQAEDVLFQLEPALKFWEGLDYVAAPFKDRPVPLGLLDNAVSYCNQLDYGQQSVRYFRESLKNQLFGRYLQQPILEDQITKQFDDGMIEVEVFSIVERGRR